MFTCLRRVHPQAAWLGRGQAGAQRAQPTSAGIAPARGSRPRVTPLRQVEKSPGRDPGDQAGTVTPPPSARCERASPAAPDVGHAAASESSEPRSRSRLHEPQVLSSAPSKEGKPLPVSVNG
ncbi:hypothetical protein NDU88_009320 [Pleurodeles waltl]|uniref:Uncharacterized protein n=1 Tax=Pleurodeles waltl TaxID=8319 RepID=A0AAV7QX74_PLEWA|nr:hypothetical protein NDU88_009320 [Pleurodeles waltl]